MDKLTMGDRIREARKKNGLTQEQLSERLEVSVEFVSKIERGLNMPSMQIFIKLVEILNVSADYLLRDSVSTGKLLGDNAIGRKIEKLTPKQRIALEALIYNISTKLRRALKKVLFYFSLPHVSPLFDKDIVIKCTYSTEY